MYLRQNCIDLGQNLMSKKKMFSSNSEIYLSVQAKALEWEQIVFLVLLRHYFCSWKESSKFSVNTTFLR